MSRETIKLQAEKYINRGKYRNAIDEYMKLLTGEEQDVLIWNIIGDLYIKAKNPLKAAEQFRRVGNFYENKGLYSKSIALYKRITKLAPDDIEARGKLAELYVQRGFLNEAEEEYRNLADKLKRAGQIESAIDFYGKLLKLNPEDTHTRNVLIGLCKKVGNKERAVDELNDAAQVEIKREAFGEAKKFLSSARKLKEDDPRTIEASVGLHLKLGERQEVFDILGSLLEKNKKNVAALKALALLFYEDEEWKKAKDLFSQLIALKHDDVRARYKLGRIHLLHKNPDLAFSAFEPLVDDLLDRNKTAKAIGLLGLILTVDGDHISTLNKLSSIFEAASQSENLRLVIRVILALFKKQGKLKESVPHYERLLRFYPNDQVLKKEYKTLKRGLGIEDELPKMDTAYFSEEAERLIEQSLAKVDLYAEQGLVKNAERILNQLRLSFPDSDKVQQKMDEIAHMSSRIDQDDIPELVRKAAEKEAELDGGAGPASSGMVVTSRDIFSGLDLFPEKDSVGAGMLFYDVSWVIEEEMQAIERASRFQDIGDFSMDEKGLRDIVSEFRTGIDRKIAADDYESRYTLGLAFFDLELYEEAIEELTTASEKDTLKLDCFNLISLCYRNLGDNDQALAWILKTRELAPEGSEQDWALKYELAELYELMGDSPAARKLFEEIKSWNPGYREVGRKVKGPKK